MRISKLTFIAWLAGAAALQLHAQPASPERQAKALELLRQAMAQRSPQPTQNAVPIYRAPAAVQPSAVQQGAVRTGPAPSTTQQRALEVLRRQMGTDQAVGSTSTQPATTVSRQPATRVTAPKPAQKGAPASTKVSARPTPQPQVTQPPAQAQTVVTPAAPVQSTGPKTKQERLSELLEQYRADQMTPAQYQAQRARILAEP